MKLGRNVMVNHESDQIFVTLTSTFDLGSYFDDISLLTHDKRKCYNNVKRCKPNTVNG